MKPSWILSLALLAAPVQGANPPPRISIAALLDEAIQRPGDFAQICDAGEPVSFDAPPIPLYGIGSPQPFSLSDAMKKHVEAHRKELIREMGARLDKLDWLHIPPAPKLPKTSLFPPKVPYQGDMDPNSPSEQNPRSLSPIMLSLIIGLRADELLPQLLRLEDSLYQITQAALKDPDNAPLPTLTTGDFVTWKGATEDFKGVEDWDKAPLKLKRKKQLFEALVFDRELLGTMLELLHDKGWAPLKTSELGTLRARELRAKAQTDEILRTIKGPEDLAKEEHKNLGIQFDRELGVPYWHWQRVMAGYSDERRALARKLVHDYLDGKKTAS